MQQDEQLRAQAGQPRPHNTLHGDDVSQDAALCHERGERGDEHRALPDRLRDRIKGHTRQARRPRGLIKGSQVDFKSASAYCTRMYFRVLFYF